MSKLRQLNELLRLVEKAKKTATQLNEQLAAHILAIVQLEITQRIEATDDEDDPVAN